MIYDIANIVPKNGEWNVWFQLDDTDRQSSKTTPNPLGFYYYPRKIGKTKAFNELKNYLIARHTQEIERLNKSLDKLIELEYPKDQ